MLNVACCLWEPNALSVDFSRCYDASWVDKLYRGFKRNLSEPFRFVCFTDFDREFREPVVSIVDETMGQNGYGDMIRPFEMGAPMILVGLDTVIVGNCDRLASYCLAADRMALPQHPREPQHACNGVALVPKGYRQVFDDWRGENDMVWLRRWPHVYIDGIFPGQVRSYKAHIRGHGLKPETRIVYMHGKPKAPDINEAWVRQHWA